MYSSDKFSDNVEAAPQVGLVPLRLRETSLTTSHGSNDAKSWAGVPVVV